MGVVGVVVVLLLGVVSRLVSGNRFSDGLLFHLHRGDTQCFTASAHAGTPLRAEVQVTNPSRGSDWSVSVYLLIAATNGILDSFDNVTHARIGRMAPAGPHHGHDERGTAADYKLCVFSRGGRADGSFRKIGVRFWTQEGADAFEDDRVGMRESVRVEDVREVMEGVGVAEERLREVGRTVREVMEGEKGLWRDVDRWETRLVWLGVVAWGTVIGGAWTVWRRVAQITLR